MVVLLLNAYLVYLSSVVLSGHISPGDLLKTVVSYYDVDVCT